MDSFIKSEPIEYDSNEHHQNEEIKTNLERCFENEAFYLRNLDNNILGLPGVEEINDLDNYMSQFDRNNIQDSFSIQNDFKLEDLFKKLSDKESKQSRPSTKPTQTAINPKITRINDQASNTASINNHLEILNQKKRILEAINQMAKDHDGNSLTQLEPMSVNDEYKLLKILGKFISDDKNLQSLDYDYLISLRRFVSKLELRKLKRKKHLKLLDIDSYVNELLDHERASLRRLNTPVKSEQSSNEHSDVIFECEILKKSSDGDCQIVAVKSVLDRFKNSSSFNYERFGQAFTYFNLMPIGMIESQYNLDVTCMISPFTNKILKPFIRRDYESMPKKLYINRYIVNRKLDASEKANFINYPIDYVHLRAEHVLPINAMCRQHFWNGIDVTECLEYPDYTCVVLYRKLIIGFALMVPNNTSKENYLSFIFVHPDWRRQVSKIGPMNADIDLINCSIAHYLLYYLIQVSGETDISLHVSVNSPAVLLYQKFGFKIEEYIKNFYDKYYTDDHNLNKDAFLMRLNNY